MHDQPTDGPVVYVIQGMHGGPVKIGYCDRRSGVPSRLAGIQTGNPHPLVVRRIMDAPHGRDTEREFHERLARYRLVGEWFLGSAEVAMVTGARLPKTSQDGRRFEPVVKSAWKAGVEHGRLVAEKEMRTHLRWFFAHAFEWMFDEDDDPEIHPTETALRRLVGTSKLHALMASDEEKALPSAHADRPRQRVTTEKPRKGA